MSGTSSSRSYSAGVINALAALSEGHCYFPGCVVPVVVFVEGTPRMNLQIAHIKALNEGGPRFDSSIPKTERNTFANLILLCVPHHTTVDQEPGSYPESVLRRWKAEREDDRVEQLQNATGVTLRALEKAIGQALEQREQRLDEAVSRLEEIDTEAACWVAELRAEVTALRQRPILSEDMVMALARATRDLRRLDEGVVNTLATAAGRLTNIESIALSLERSAGKLSRHYDG